MEVAAKGLDDLLRLVGAHQPVVDEHAGQLVADRLVDEQRRHGRVDATREPADDALRADLGPDPLDLLLDHGGGRPRRRSTGDLVEEVLEDLLPVGRVHDLRVELDGIETTARVLERRDRRRRGRRGDAGAGRRLRDGVAVAHPDDLIRREIVEERRLAERRLGLSVLGDVVRLDVPAEIAGHHLHPVTDPERRDAELEHVGIHLRRTLGVDRGRPAGEDQRERVPRAHLGRRDAMADDLRVDASLAHPARDQLAVLAAEVEHEHRALLGRRRRDREGEDFRALSHAGNSVRPS